MHTRGNFVRTVVLTPNTNLIHSAQFVLMAALGKISAPKSKKHLSHQGDTKCKERLSGSIIQRVTDSSVGKMDRMYSCTTRRLSEMVTGRCRKEMRSNLRSCRS